MKENTVTRTLDSGVANEYMLAYLAEAVKRAQLDPEQAEAVRQGFLGALDTFTASEIYEAYRG